MKISKASKVRVAVITHHYPNGDTFEAWQYPGELHLCVNGQAVRVVGHSLRKLRMFLQSKKESGK